MRIRPTLFVGLGTSGVEIIAHFRRMMYEQFTRAGLPCFQYLGIETNAEAKPPDDEYRFDEYGRIDFLRTTVDNMTAIRVNLDDSRPEYWPHMKRWIDPTLLINENAVEKGANHIRMLGRLALWKNWDRVENALTNAFSKLDDSDGVSALWNPKYRFAEAFACEKAIKFCEDLIGSSGTGRDGLIQKIVHDRWRTVLREASDYLVNPRGRPSINERIHQLIQDIDKKTRNVPLAEMAQALYDYPKENALRTRFAQRGEFIKDMKDMKDVFAAELRGKLSTLVEDLVKALDPLNEDLHAETILNVSELDLFLRKLRDVMTEDGQAGEETLPSFQFKGTSLPTGHYLIGSFWPALVFKPSESEAKFRSRYLKEFKGYVDSLVQRCGMHFARNPILKLRETLIDDLSRRVQEIKGLLEETVAELKKQHKAAMTQTVQYPNTWEIAHEGYSGRLSDLYGQLDIGRRRDMVTQVLRNLSDDEHDKRQRTWNDIVTRKAEELTGIFKYPFFTWALEQRIQWNLAEEALRKYKTPDDIRPIVRRSFPYCRMIGDYQSWRPKIHSTLERLCGKSVPVKLKENANRSESEQRPFEIAESSLDNLVVFYRQEAPFHIDDLAAAPHMITRYNEIMGSNAKPVHCEIDPTIFDKGHLDRLAGVEDMVEAIQLLYPDEAFTRYGDNLVFVYTRPNGRSEAISVTADADKQRFIARLARQDEEGTQAYNAFELRVRQVLQGRDRDKVLERAGELHKEWLRTRTPEQAEALYAKVWKLIERFLPQGAAPSAS